MIAPVAAQDPCKTCDLHPQTPTLTRVTVIIPRRSIIIFALTFLTLRAFVIARASRIPFSPLTSEPLLMPRDSFASSQFPANKRPRPRLAAATRLYSDLRNETRSCDPALIGAASIIGELSARAENVSVQSLLSQEVQITLKRRSRHRGRRAN
jgi:hypothetical protein